MKRHCGREVCGLFGELKEGECGWENRQSGEVSRGQIMQGIWVSIPIIINNSNETIMANIY